jgi:replicative DNA helicase
MARPPQFTGRTLPHSQEAEDSLLACCIFDGRTAVTRCIAAKLTPASFYDSRNGRIFAALLALHGRQDEIDASTLAVELSTSGELEPAGGYAHLTTVSRPPPTTAGLTVFLRTVREKWILREVIRGGSKLVEECFESREDMTALLSPHVAWFQAALARVVHGERAGLTLRERVDEVKVELANRASGNEDKSRWICTGMESFDRQARPLGSDAEDHLIVVGGGSGHGKSALMRQWAGAALKSGQMVLNYTRETSVKGWIRQLASNWARVDLRSLSEAPPDMAAKLQAECDRICEYVDQSLFVFQQEPGCSIETIEDMMSHARAWAWQHGAPHMIVVDYLQLFGTKRRTNNREQEVAHVSHSLQALQRELGSVMMIGAQLNESGLREMRMAKRDEEGRLIPRLPNAGDFRESQAIFHDADRVIAIYRPAEDCRGADNYGPNTSQPEQWLCQIKRRYGGEASVKCWFEKRFLNFREFNRTDAEAAEKPRVKEGGQEAAPRKTKGDWRPKSEYRL